MSPTGHCGVRTSCESYSSVTIEERCDDKGTYSRWWRLFRDDILKRDMAWIESVHPNHHTLESWMRENKYDGQFDPELLKGHSGHEAALSINSSVVGKL